MDEDSVEVVDIGLADLSWAEFIKSRALYSLTNSSTTFRLEFLNHSLLPRIKAEKLSDKTLGSLLYLIFLTYSRYNDRPSRFAMINVLKELNNWNSDQFLRSFVPLVIKETDRLNQKSPDGTTYTTPSSNRFVLLTWVNLLISFAISKKSPEDSPYWKNLVDAQAILLHSLISENEKRKNIKRSALFDVRRSIRKSPFDIPSYISYLISNAKACNPIYKNAVLLGTVIDCSLKLRKSVGKSYVENAKDDIIQYYITAIASSKTPVPKISADALHDFMNVVVTEEDFRTKLTPILEKQLLRAPEIVIQMDAAELLNILFEKSLNEDVVIEIVNYIIQTLTGGKMSNPEHRIILLQTLAHVHQSPIVVKTVINGLFPIVSKESNETSLAIAKAIDTLGLHVGLLLRSAQDISFVEKIIKVIVDGLFSTKAGVRKAWAIIIGRMVWEETNSPSTSLKNATQKFLNPLISTLEKIQSNPLVFTGDDLIGAKKLMQNVLVTALKPSFLFWDKVYSKLSTYEEGFWFIRALEGVLLDKNEALVFLSTAFIYMITAFSNHQIRHETYDTLKRCIQGNIEPVGEIFRKGLTQWVLNLEKNVKDSTAILASGFAHSDPIVNAYRLSQVLTAITTFSKEENKHEVESSLVELIVLAHHPLIVSPNNKYNWISLVQRAQLDPGKLVENYSGRLRQIIQDKIEIGYESKYFYKAAISAIATITFISPETIIPLFLTQCHRNLDASLFENIGKKEIEIWKTEEGTLFIDVLKRSKKVIVENRNRKDYKTEKWERELRESIAKKKGTTKLTKEEQAAVDAQLAKESEIRKNVEQVRLTLIRGLDIVDALVESNSEAIEQHIVEFMRLLNIIVQKSGPLVGDKAVNTYLRINKCTSEKIESIRDFIGLATLRAMDVQEVPERWLQEPLGHLVTRVLYRLRFISDRSLLPPSSFAYCFPLIHQVINKGGIGYESKEERDVELLMEQIALGLDVLSFHSAIGSSPLLPRTEMIQVLLQIIKEHPKLNKIARTALVNLCEAIGETAERKEIETILNGLLSSESFVRYACLQALNYLDLTEIDFSCELWVSCFDEDENNSKLALILWEDNGMDVDPNYALELLPLLIQDEKYVQVTASKAIGKAAAYFPNSITETLNLIYNLYKEKAIPIKPEYDEFAMVRPESLNKKDPWEARVGVALVLGALAPNMKPSDLIQLFEFLINCEAVGDINAQVRQRMLEAGLAVIDAHGAKNVTLLMPVLENYLDKPDSPSETHDRIRESVVIWFGALARHLNPTDTRIPVVISKLLETLKTPSEAVQTAVGECLPPLIKSMKENAPNLIKGLLDQLFHSEKYAERRGAAFGLAGVVKGTGISALKDCNVMTSLKEGVDNKKDYKSRQGALFAFETLSQALGRLFEPYIIQILPLLLVCFGDSHPEVREATSDASRVIMSKISGHCVKLILPSLLAGLDDRQWRTKKGSVELLGAMAFCAPKQLSISLPTIVPRLTNVLTDSHTSVQSAANEALLHFGEVINNPEIQALVPILLKGLSDPDKHTNAALNSLLETAFVHYIDAPSLALVMPILERGLRERGTEIKKKSSQIVGNMASLTDVRDLVPYLPRLLPGLKEVLVDPVPDARATAAKALGTMVEKLGEDKFPNLVNELVHTLKSDTSGVDRQGAAQGLSEVLAGLGLERLDGLLPEIVNNTNSSKSYVREGFISLLIYLPATFGLRFQPYLGRIIPPILSGLADESEYVRDASLRAGQMIVANYATKAVDLLLPELEIGLFDDNWRIRQSSVQLMGDLLYRITGISASRKALLQVLGKERRDRVLAALYIVRQDVSGIVRQASIHVWKVIVSNTPRTVKDILPIMMGMIIRSLASPSYERRQVAGRTLGELVRKLGESVLSEIVPILKEGLESQESDMRQGVCIGLSEVMSTAGKVQVIDYVDSIIPAVRKALVDESSDVREAAAQAFDTLQQHVGDKAIDEILPTLLNSLQSGDDSVYALEALKEIMAVRANLVFPVLIPTLIQTPITTFNARALASLVTVAGPALNKRLTQILSALIVSLGTETDENAILELQETEKALILSIDNAEGLQTLMTMLFEAVKSDDPSHRAGACDIVTIFCNESKVDYSRYVTEWIRVLVLLLDDRQKNVVKAAWNALAAVIKPLKKDELEQIVIPVRRAVKSVGVPDVDLPGFCLPKGISPILPIFLQGLMYGTAEIREQSALGIGDLIQRTSAEALRSFVTQITGPLIRIIGDRYPPQVKAAILHTLGLLLNKVPAHLKPFIPQLQRTFIKSLSDPSSALVRSRAALALGILISLQTRVDPLITELITGIKTSEPNVKETMLSALESVINKAGAGMNDSSKKNVIGVIVDGLSDNSDKMVIGASRLFGSLCKHITPQEAIPIISSHVLGSPSQSSLMAINAILAESSRMFFDMGNTREIVEIISKGSASNLPHIADTAIMAAGKMLLIDIYHEESTFLIEALATNVREPATLLGETKRLSLSVFRTVGKKYPQILEPHLSIIIPPMMACARDRVVPVKLAAELALVYVLQLLESEAILQQYLSTVDETTAKSITDFHKRVLTKIVIQEQQKIPVGITGDMDEEEQEIWAVGNIGTFASNVIQE
ncbi:4749_t:CDS:10 [Funneliformis caledonium]|uniref:eIF-2-alpha kinase activator GCN1 n=1 Tax=Funneliformis caledonium TaxID=1117310 RepID=A0A9N9FEW7_9GLOM|nr:4749_t:CDS:10 [Funneliformis caledonium]